MILKELHLHRGYIRDKDPLQGTMKVRGGSGEITLTINDEQAAKIVAVVADALVETARQSAQLMVSDIIEHNPQAALEAQ